MICIKANIPEYLNSIDDELKAIYHSKNSVCIWLFKSRLDRNKFMDETIGCLLYTSPSPRDRTRSRMPSSA